MRWMNWNTVVDAIYVDYEPGLNKKDVVGNVVKGNNKIIGYVCWYNSKSGVAKVSLEPCIPVDVAIKGGTPIDKMECRPMTPEEIRRITWDFWTDGLSEQQDQTYLA